MSGVAEEIAQKSHLKSVGNLFVEIAGEAADAGFPIPVGTPLNMI